MAGPALTQLGLDPLQAHLFVFWYALLSTITPPVCGAVFISAGMVNENWLQVAFTAMALGVGLYLIPLGMIANPPGHSIGTRTPLGTSDIHKNSHWTFNCFLRIDWLQKLVD